MSKTHDLRERPKFKLTDVGECVVGRDPTNDAEVVNPSGRKDLDNCIPVGRKGELMEFTTKWTDGTDQLFTEIVEALGLPATDHIMAAMEGADDTIVLFTPVHESDPRRSVVCEAALQRDADGVLRLCVEPTRIGTAGDFVPEF